MCHLFAFVVTFTMNFITTIKLLITFFGGEVQLDTQVVGVFSMREKSDSGAIQALMGLSVIPKFWDRKGRRCVPAFRETKIFQ